MNRNIVIVIAGGSALVLGLGAAGCLKDETLDSNRAPTANAGEDQHIDLESGTVEVRLDGRKSSDIDGKIVSYQWRSANPLPDGGVGVYTGEDGELDPDDVARPTVTLGQGNYTFTLWVTDDEATVSEPDSVTIGVGTDPVMECVDATWEMVPRPCAQCVCEIDDTCRAASAMCGEDCWSLLTCIVMLCPGVMDTTCIVAMCGDYLGGATGAMAIGMPCVVAHCSEACAPPPIGDGAVADGAVADGG